MKKLYIWSISINLEKFAENVMSCQQLIMNDAKALLLGKNNAEFNPTPVPRLFRVRSQAGEQSANGQLGDKGRDDTPHLDFYFI